MPYLVNLEAAESFKWHIKISESIPVTIGLIDGHVTIGGKPVKLLREDVGITIALERVRVRPGSIFSATGFNLTFCRSSQHCSAGRGAYDTYGSCIPSLGDVHRAGHHNRSYPDFTSLGQFSLLALDV